MEQSRHAGREREEKRAAREGANQRKGCTEETGKGDSGLMAVISDSDDEMD